MFLRLRKALSLYAYGERSHKRGSKYGMFPYRRNCGMTKARFLQRWLRLLIWAHLEPEDGLLDQPGVAIEPHSGVTAAPHPRRQRSLLHTDTTCLVWCLHEHDDD